MACGPVLAIICMILQAFIFLFAVIMTPIDVFRSKVKVAGLRACYSMWGVKRCGTHGTITNLEFNGFPCSKNRHTMQAAAAFSIISIFFTLLTMIFCILLICKCMGKIVCGIFSIICFLLLLLVWACQAGTYYQRCIKGGSRFKDGYNYGGSFGLAVTAWCLQLVVTILIFVS